MFPKIRYIKHNEKKEAVRFEIDLESEGMPGTTVEFEKVMVEEGDKIKNIWIARIRGLDVLVPVYYEMERENLPLKDVAIKGIQLLYGTVMQTKNALVDIDIYFTELLTEGRPKEKDAFSEKVKNLFN